jgi:ankyrin repeat domain-containing protein 50
VLDGLDEYEKELLRQLLDAVRNYLSSSRDKSSPRLRLILLSRLGLSLRFLIIPQLVTLYMKYVAFDRWENMSGLQELVEEKKTNELREWPPYSEFFVQPLLARDPAK